MKRPRARRTKEDGTTEEVRLQTYESARQLDQLHSMALRAFSSGVSGREMAEVHPESPEVGGSPVIFQIASAAALQTNLAQVLSVSSSAIPAQTFATALLVDTTPKG